MAIYDLVGIAYGTPRTAPARRTRRQLAYELATATVARVLAVFSPGSEVVALTVPAVALVGPLEWG